MAHAVADAIDGKGHLLVQAGTGTGKSLAYLVPAVRHAMDSGTPTVVATATLALQAQIVDRDMPRLAESLAPLLGRRPTYALVKGRRNYLCAHKLEGGFPDDDVDTLMSVGAVDQQASRLGAEVVRLRDWAEVTESGDLGPVAQPYPRRPAGRPAGGPRADRHQGVDVVVRDPALEACGRTGSCGAP